MNTHGQTGQGRAWLMSRILLVLLACQAVSCDGNSAPTVQSVPATGPVAGFKPFSFVLASDPHVGRTTGTVERFGRLARQVNALEPDFVLIAGDMTHGLTEKQTASLDAGLKVFDAPVHMVPGNHDVEDHESLATWRRKYGNDYHAFTHNNCEFICLNSMTLSLKGRGLKPRDKAFAGEVATQWEWLEAALARAAAAGRTHIFLSMHIPPFVRRESERSGYRNMPVETRRRLLAVARKHGVRAIFAGHIHQTRRIVADGLSIYTVGGTYLPVDLSGKGFPVFTVESDRIEARFVPLAKRGE